MASKQEYEDWKQQVEDFKHRDHRDVAVKLAARDALAFQALALIKGAFHGPTVAKKALEMWGRN